MLIRDDESRDALWSQQGGICAYGGHPIAREQSLLSRVGSTTAAAGLLGASLRDPDVLAACLENGNRDFPCWFGTLPQTNSSTLYPTIATAVALGQVLKGPGKVRDGWLDFLFDVWELLLRQQDLYCGWDSLSRRWQNPKECGEFYSIKAAQSGYTPILDEIHEELPVSTWFPIALLRFFKRKHNQHCRRLQRERGKLTRLARLAFLRKFEPTICELIPAMPLSEILFEDSTSLLAKLDEVFAPDLNAAPFSGPDDIWPDYRMLIQHGERSHGMREYWIGRIRGSSDDIHLSGYSEFDELWLELFTDHGYEPSFARAAAVGAHHGILESAFGPLPNPPWLREHDRLEKFEEWKSFVREHFSAPVC